MRRINIFSFRQPSKPKQKGLSKQTYGILSLLLISLLRFTLGASSILEEDISEEQEAYINKFKHIAISEMERAGIPASIKLAQGLLESAAGSSVLASNANNHFGIKCGSAWEGKEYYREDDDYVDGELVKSCFRVYKNPEESFSAHSDFLRDPKKDYRYGFLFDLDPTDYESWAKGLKKAGYATSPTYPQKLISLIEKHDLHQYDLMSSQELDGGGSNSNRLDDGDILNDKDFLAGMNIINDLHMVFATQGETINRIANKYGLKSANLVFYNETHYQADETLGLGTPIYLQKKRKYYRKNTKYHYVRDGENMFAISQRYGIRMDKLYEMNLMPPQSEPAYGEKILLRGKVRSQKNAPKLRSQSQLPDIEDNNQPNTDPSDVVLVPWEPEEEVIQGLIPENSLIDIINEIDNAEFDQGDFNDWVPDNNDNYSPEPWSPSDNNQQDPWNTNDNYTPDDPWGTNDNGINNGSNNLPDSDDSSFYTDDNQRELSDILDNSTNLPDIINDESRVHLVQKGETLYAISRKYNQSVEKIKQLNNLTTNNIKVNQRLLIPNN